MLLPPIQSDIFGASEIAIHRLWRQNQEVLPLEGTQSDRPVLRHELGTMEHSQSIQPVPLALQDGEENMGPMTGSTLWASMD